MSGVGCAPHTHAGMMSAQFVICELANRPFEPKRVEVISDTFRRKLRIKLLQREKAEFGNVPDRGGTPVADEGEIAHVVEDVWFCRSAFNESRKAFKGLALTRWDRAKPALPYNLVLLEVAEADAHDKETQATGALAAGLADSQRLQFIHGRMVDLERRHHAMPVHSYTQ
jgi:hypothetical protein